MRKASEEPLAKMTMKFFASDIEFLRAAHGWGYSVVVRDLVRAHVKAVKATTSTVDLEAEEWEMNRDC